MGTDEKINLLKIVAFIAGFIFIFWSLGIIWAREQVKKDLQQQGFAPISIRWRPLAFWAWLGEVGFIAMFVDVTGCIQKARCSVWYSKVRWIANDVKYLNKNLSLAGKLAYLIISLVLIYFGLKYLIRGELMLPPSLKNPNPIYLHGWPLIFLSFAALCHAASLMIAIAYCYHVSANEQNYILLSRSLSMFSWMLLALSLGVYFYQFFKNPNQFYLPLH